MTKIITIDDLVNDYTLSRQFKQLATSTKGVYITGFDKMINWFGGGFKIENMTPRNAVGFYENLLDHVSDKYAAAMIKGPKAAFQTLVDLREAEINPFTIMNLKIKYDPRSVVWSKEEFERFLETAKADDKLSYLYPFVGMLYLSAHRPEDVREIHWGQRHWSAEHNAYCFEITQQKTGTEVAIWVTDQIEKVLTALDERYCSMLFTKNGEHVSLQTFRNDFKKLLVKAGLRQELQMRDLRRSRATHLIDAGYTSEQVMSITGHKSLSVFEKTYKVTSRETSAFILNI